MPPFPLFDPDIDNQVTSPRALGLKGDAAERRARDQRLARAAVRDKGQNKPDPEVPGVLANASPTKLAGDLANGYLKHLETLGQLPIAPGVTFEDWNKGQQLRVKQDTSRADESKSKEDQRLLDRARGVRAGREMSKAPQNLDVARAEQKLKDIPQGPRKSSSSSKLDGDLVNGGPRTISNSHWNDYHAAVTMTDDSAKNHLKFAEIPNKEWAGLAPAAAHTEAFIKTGGDRKKLDNYSEIAAPKRPVQFTDTLTHLPGQDITLEQADQLYSGDRRKQALAEWQRNRDAQSKPPMQAGVRASKGAKAIKGSGGASAEEGSGGESDMATGPSFQASRPQGVQSSVMQQQPQQGNHKGSVLGTLAGVGLGIGTGNWAPLASHILGSGAGAAVGAAAGGGGENGQTSQPSQSGDSAKASGEGSSDGVQPQAQGAAGMETYIPLLAHLLGQKVATIMPQQQGGGFGGAPMPQQQSSGGWGESYGQTPSPIQYPQGNQPPNPFGA